MNRMVLIASIVLATVFGVIMAGLGQEVDDKAGCDWVMVGHVKENPPPDKDPKELRDVLTGKVVSRGLAFANANMDNCNGHGSAFDRLVGPDFEILVQAKRVGLRRQSWRNRASQLGRATVNEVLCKIEGEARLERSQCAAFALGFTQFTSNILENSVHSELTKSAGETVTEKLGDLKLEYKDLGLSIEIPITINKGTGRYPDTDADSGSGEKCVDFYTFEHKTMAHIKCFADAGLFSSPIDGAFCRAEMKGSVKSKSTLDCCPKPGS